MVKLADLKTQYDQGLFLHSNIIDALADLIVTNPKFMCMLPILTRPDGTIITGRMRYWALKQIGFDSIPESWVKCISDLKPPEQPRYLSYESVKDHCFTVEVHLQPWEAEHLKYWGFDVEERII